MHRGNVNSDPKFLLLPHKLYKIYIYIYTSKNRIFSKATKTRTIKGDVRYGKIKEKERKAKQYSFKTNERERRFYSIVYFIKIVVYSIERCNFFPNIESGLAARYNFEKKKKKTTE